MGAGEYYMNFPKSMHRLISMRIAPLCWAIRINMSNYTFSLLFATTANPSMESTAIATKIQELSPVALDLSESVVSGSVVTGSVVSVPEV